jgi:DNA-binding transcriptional LysR family regulator
MKKVIFLDFKELQYIASIARNHSITKAAQELFISQPSLSKYLQNLETNLGIKLFNRLGNRFVLTYAGERYVGYAKRILLVKKELDDELSDISNLNKGRINIAFPLIRGSYMIPATLPRFREMYPNVEVNLFEESSSVLEKLLLSGEADIAIFNHPINNPELDYEILRKEEIVLAVSKDHPLANHGSVVKNCKFPWIDIKLFENDDFILYFPEQRTGQIALQIFEAAQISPRIILRTRSIEGALRLASSGYGLCFVAATHLKFIYLKPTPNYFSIGNPKTEVELVVAFRKGAYLPLYTQDYIKIVKSCL